MKLTPDWQDVLRYAWSIRLLILAAVFQAAEIIVRQFPDAAPIPEGWLPWATAISIAGATATRLLAQKEFPNG